MLEEKRVTESALARPLRVLLVADPHSPTTWGWVDAIRSAGVVVLGSDGQEWPEYPDPATHGSARGLAAPLRRWFRSFSKATPRRLAATQELRRLLGPSLAWLKGRRLRRLVSTANPDLIHALRIPFEGMVAAAACPPGVPLAVSIWGNDLTLQAPANPLIARATRRVLARTELLFADCQRDLDLAKTWGFGSMIPPLVLAGGGGIDMTRYGESAFGREPSSDGQESDHRIIVNARGLRQYVRNDTLLGALSILAPEIDPRVRIVFVDASDDKNLCAEIAQHPLADKIIVTGRRSPAEMADLFRRAEVSVSITDHDGTPNSLLEAMAAGALPVCGDIPAIREWIEHGRNGFLAAPDNSPDVASALRIAMNLSAADRKAIVRENRLTIAAKAERRATGQEAAREYLRLVATKGG